MAEVKKKKTTTAKTAAKTAAKTTTKKKTTKKVVKKKIIIKKIHHVHKKKEAPPSTPAPTRKRISPNVTVSIPAGADRTPQRPAGGRGGRRPDAKKPVRGRDRRHGYAPKSRYRDDFNQEDLIYHKRKQEAARILPKDITILEHITVGDLAKKLNIKAGEIIKKLMSLGMMATITDVVDAETASILCDEYGVKVNIASLYEETLVKEEEAGAPDTEPRDPVVTVMGHVDHGKTHLLDSIRHTRVRDTESGLITQHIGAYKAYIKHGKKQKGIVFLDTPGHEAFTSMRARGASITDIVILIVAADDGVMPQTIEALNHAKEAKVPIIVAINKIDLPAAKKNLEKIKQEIAKHGIVPEEWGGENIFVEISAKEKTNIDKLLDSVLLVADLLELKANTERMAVGTVIESRIDPGFGPSSTVLVKNGTLKTGDAFVAGIYCGKVRSMHNENGEKMTTAGPSTPVMIYGIDGIPSAGDPFQVVSSEKYAKQISAKRKELEKYEENKNVKKVTLTNFINKIKEGELKELNLIIKADVKGSIEALEYSFNKLSQENDKVRIKIVHSGTGPINETDVLLASTSQAVIVGFHIRPNSKAEELAANENVEVRTYEIIYKAIDDVKHAMEGLLDPKITEENVAKLEVRNIFKISRIGTIAGCYVTDGKALRTAKARLIREGEILFEGGITSLKRFKEDVKEVQANMECGLQLENFNDIKVGDKLELYQEKKEAQKLFS